MARSKSSRRPGSGPSGQGSTAQQGGSNAQLLSSVRGAAVRKTTSVTQFQERLYALCKCVPAGKVVTYRTLAVLLHSAPRAVGQGMRRNPFAPVVPCHRVIAASLDLGGFNGGWGQGSAAVGKKRRLLAGEGVLFTEGGRLADVSCLMGRRS